MSNPTTPFSWQMPTATDLVTDLPADFEVFGQAVATDLADLLGGPSGYILSKNSATDMDFVWIANDQGDITGITAGTGITVTNPTGPTPTVTNSMATIFDAKGDLIAGTADDSFARLAVGSNNLFLQADSSQATGLKYGGAYSSWTPTLTNMTLGNGTMLGKFVQIGKFVNASLQIVFGSTTSVTGTMTFSVPTGASTANTSLNTVIGNVRMLDAGTQNYLGMVQLSSSSSVILVVMNTSGTYATVQNVNATVPFTWGTGDELQFSFSYEAV